MPGINYYRAEIGLCLLLRRIMGNVQNFIINSYSKGILITFQLKPITMDLLFEVKKGTFREDLFFRINIVQISLPPLRERKEDIPLLVEHFLKMHGINAIEKKICPEALECLMNYNWSGNIRELKNLIENLVILTDGEKIGVCNLPEEIRGHVEAKEHRLDGNISLNDLERQHIINTLSKMNGNKTRGAEALGISLKTLYNKIKSYNIPY